MKVGALIEPRLPGAAEFAVAAERIGVTSLWVPEVWGYDALTGLAYLAAKTSSINLGTFVVQLGSRSPAMLATSALSLQALSGGRFLLGIGTSGPRVMEGWHGVRFRKPVQTTRETIEIVRIVSRGERLEHAGEVYPLPLPDSRGAALRPMVKPDHVPVYVAAMGPQNLRLTGELADGWLGNAFIPEAAEVFFAPLRKGAQQAGRTLDQLDLVAPVAVEFHDDQAAADAAARRHADGYAFTIGAMGTGSKNFYNDAFTRLGYGAEVETVAGLWQAGKQDEARSAVPLDLGRLTNLLGTPDAIADRVSRYRAAGITTLLAKLEGDPELQLATLQRLVAIAEAA
ncbi:MAG TPA: LLM class flavin-dependent oxidoreductase [Mycobacterium sp.]|uniref:LLM class flavin-dependent oxidoreductase n=1 Tax=Mycobacterium sp. TaxID=1785 RepID=UPI002D0284C7|nr:LLM class flavin-dependent oxidoreductase [Mycobacterium sp.]HME75922.1 LLM class flavin-dependent oxidoreductase [Mycobacterium sp.]